MLYLFSDIKIVLVSSGALKGFNKKGSPITISHTQAT